MKNPRRFAPALIVATLAAPLTALAHPGHDDPEITWDFDHLVEHPFATLACLAALGFAAWMIRRSLHQADQEVAQSLRDEQDKPGK